jgi:mRNA-degrading endonuclease toxin of MazEF toxin-antitoxin module
MLDPGAGGDDGRGGTAGDYAGVQSPLGCRPEVSVGGKPGRVLLDQLRSVDKSRLAAKLGEIDAALWHRLLLQMLG